MLNQDAVRRTYPKIPAKNWFDLRRRIIQALPPALTVDYLQSVLGLEGPSARNLLPPLRAVGIIDDSGRLTDLAHEWRSDQDYADACARMLARTYPEDVIAAFPGPDVDRAGLERWFMRNARVGEAAARQLAAFYLLLAVPSLEEKEARPAAARETAPSARRTPAGEGRVAQKRGRGQGLPDKSANRLKEIEDATRIPMPSVHVDVQVHIDPGASAEQIDRIFSAMARHLYGRE